MMIDKYNEINKKVKEDIKRIEQENLELLVEIEAEQKLLKLAAQDGDLRENYSYQQHYEILSELASEQMRISEMLNIYKSLDVSVIPDTDKSSSAYVRIGSYITIEMKEFKEPTSFLIVDKLIGNPKIGLLSNESKVAKGLLRRTINNTVDIMTHAGEFTYKILDVYNRRIL